MATKTSKKAAPKTEKKTEVNGTYDFLVSHFEKPGTLIDAATALAEHSKIDPNVAAKKVEAFLENAKLDSALEVRAGTGKNVGQFVIARMPQDSPAKETSMKVQKKTEKKTVEKRLSDPEAIKCVMLNRYHSIPHIVEALKGLPSFHNRTEKRIRDVVMGMTRKHFAVWRAAQGLKVEKREHKGEIEFRLFSSADPN